MCGIAGIVGPDGCSLRTTLQMMGALAHRGPDGAGWAVFADSTTVHRCAHGGQLQGNPELNGWAALGHVRLAILDRSEDGLQPMQGQGGRWWIALNGEIYNYVELREELDRLGYRFHTGTDTEVLLAALEQWGERCLSRLDGMFALAAVDTEARRLLLARDRFGEKPLYYWVDGNRLIFSSELPAILEAGAPRQLDEDMAAAFLVHASTHLPDRSFVHGIRHLDAGCAIWIEAANAGAIKPFRWYELAPAADAPKTPGEAVEMFSSLLEQSVVRRLRSDVAVGSCLSGGLDSSTLVALARRGLTGTSSFHAFTAAPDHEGDSELSWARMVGEHLGLILHPVPVNASSLQADLGRLVTAQGEPFTTLSMYSQYKLMEAARREGVVVLLDGQGGDEVFLGYPKVFGVAAGEALRRGQPLRAFRIVRGARENANLSPWKSLKMMMLSMGVARHWIRRRRVPHLAAGVAYRSGMQEETGANLADLVRIQLLNNPLPALLRYEDRNAMAWAVEARLPFLSHELVEASLATPPEWKIAGGFTKYPLRKIAEQILPASIAWRKDKMGFQAPTGKWLAQLSPILMALGRDCRSAVLYRRLPWEDIRKGNLEERAAFRMVSLEIWMRAFRISA